jgi:hypothetical protein
MPNGSDVMLALQILSMVAKEPLSMHPEHDEIWIGHDVSPKMMDKTAVKKLKELGFDWDDSIPAWHGFVSA